MLRSVYSRRFKSLLPSIELASRVYLQQIKPFISAETYPSIKHDISKFISSEEKNNLLNSKLMEQKSTDTKQELQPNSQILLNRSPIPNSSSWWFLFPDSREIPSWKQRNLPQIGTLTELQIKRTARLINHFLALRDVIKSENGFGSIYNHENAPANMFKSIFNSYRVPGVGTDIQQTNLESDSKHIIVMIKDQLYKMDVMHQDGSFCVNSEIERCLYEISKDSLTRTLQPGVGSLTSMDRDEWAKQYQALSSSSKNRDNLDVIRDAMFFVCLDDFAIHQDHERAHKQIMLSIQGKNRWFDAGFQLIVTNSGIAGVVGETSSIDPIIYGLACDKIVENELKQDQSTFSNEYLPQPVRLNWRLDSSTQFKIKSSSTELKKSFESIDIATFKFDHFGYKYINQIPKSSVDSFIQLMIQITFMRLKKSIDSFKLATYEYLTEEKTVKRNELDSICDGSWSFAQKFDDVNIYNSDKLNGFKEAISQLESTKEYSLFGINPRDYLNLQLENENPNEFVNLLDELKRLEKPKQTIFTRNDSLLKHVSGGFWVLKDGYNLSFKVTDDSISLFILGDSKLNIFEFSECFERTLKDVMCLFPTRTQVWGVGWKRNHERNKLIERYIGKMKEWSEKRLDSNFTKGDYERYYVSEYIEKKKADVFVKSEKTEKVLKKKKKIETKKVSNK